MPGVLSFATTAGSKLRWHDKRAALDVLVRAAMARVASARRGPSVDFARGTRLGAGAVNAFRHVGQLSYMESLDPPLAVEFSDLPGRRRLIRGPILRSIAVASKTSIARLKL